MAKSVIITFTTDGALVQDQCSATGIRQGDGAGEVKFVAAFLGRRNDEYVAKLHFVRPDGKGVQNVVMSPSSSDPNEFVFTANSAWYFAVPGTARATITITSTQGAVAAQGSYSFNVEATEVEVADSTLTYDEAAALEGLIADLDGRCLKTAHDLGTVQGVTDVEAFVDECYNYVHGLPKDGDRFQCVGTIEGDEAHYFGEFRSAAKMLVHVLRVQDQDNGLYLVSLDGGQVESDDRVFMASELANYFTGNVAKRAERDASGNVITSTYETKADALAKDAASVHKTGAETIGGKKTFTYDASFGTSDADNSKTLDVYYTANLRGPVNSYTIIPGNGGFTLGNHDHYWYRVFAQSIYMTGLNEITATTETNGSLLFRVGPASYTTNYSLPHKGPYALTIATTADVATAKSEALVEAAATAQQKVNALAEAMNFSNGAFTKIVTALLQVTKMEVVETQTKSAQVEDQFIELLAGNTESYGNQPVGLVFPKIDGVNDFCVTVIAGTLVLGYGTIQRTNGKPTGFIPVPGSALEPIMARAQSNELTNGHLLMWDGVNFRAIDGGFTASEVMSVLGQESERVLAEQGRASAENARQAIEVTREKILPFPMTTAEYNHIKDDGWYYNVFADGTYSVTETAAQDALRYYLFQSDALYQLTDDTAMAQALATISAATDLINSIDFVTAEQWAELYAQSALVSGTHYVLDDENHMKKLCVDIPAAEAERQAFLKYSIEHEGYGITRAELAMLNANGVFGVHFATVSDELTTVMTVYASRALAEAADEEHIFPMTQGVVYPLLD